MFYLFFYNSYYSYNSYNSYIFLPLCFLSAPIDKSRSRPVQATLPSVRAYLLFISTLAPTEPPTRIIRLLDCCARLTHALTSGPLLTVAPSPAPHPIGWTVSLLKTRGEERHARGM